MTAKLEEWHRIAMIDTKAILARAEEALGFVRFDEMTWHLPQCGEDGLQWRLRYAPATITRSDMLTLAESLCSYHALIFKTQKDRNYICKKLQEAMAPVGSGG